MRGRVKGSKNVRNRTVQKIMQKNSADLLEIAIQMTKDDPKTNMSILLKLLDKIVPTVQLTANVDISKKYEQELDKIAMRATQLLDGYQKTDKEIVVFDMPSQPAEFSEIKPVETLSQSEPTQDMPKESESLKTDLNAESGSTENPA